MVVITLHELEVWGETTERCQVAVSSIIAYDEALFHSQDDLGSARTSILRPTLRVGG